MTANNLGEGNYSLIMSAMRQVNCLRDLRSARQQGSKNVVWTGTTHVHLHNSRGDVGTSPQATEGGHGAV